MTRRGKLKYKNKSLSLGAERIYKKGIVRFPEFLIRYGKLNISLEGLAPDWNKLRLKTDLKEQVVLAADVFKSAAAEAPSSK